MLRVLFLLVISISSNAQVASLVADVEAEWGFGSKVKVEGSVAVVGVPNGDGSAPGSGFVYVYEQLGNGWSQTAQLTSDLVGTDDSFGFSIDVSQGSIFVGAPSADAMVQGEVLDRSGLVWVFEKIDGQWQQTQILQPELPEEQDGFGIRIYASSGRLFVSQADFNSPDGTATGGVTVFEYINNSWVQTAFISEDEVLGTQSTLGSRDISFDVDTLVVPYTYGGPRRSVKSEIYIYRLKGSTWEIEAKLKSPLDQPNDCFGCSNSIKGDRLVVAAANENMGLGGVYLYEREGDVWSLVHKFQPENLLQPGFFGTHVVLGVDQLFISKAYENNISSVGDYGAGEVFIYEILANNWQLTSTISAAGIQERNEFGDYMDLDHDKLIVGAPYTSEQVGAVYVIDVTPVKDRQAVNAGLNGNWFNNDTAGQGLFLDVSPALDFSFMGWFTYDNAAVDEQLGPIGADGQRWLVGAGDIDEVTSSITYDLYYSHDGLFDDPREVSTVDLESYGSMIIEFQSCSTALVTYHLFETGISNSFSIARPVAGSDSLCADLATAQPTLTDGFDYRLNGTWFNPETPGQGLFIDNFKGVDVAFMGWFTYDTELQMLPAADSIGAMGQRWLVGSGAVDEDNSNVLNYQLYYSYGGLFDDPLDVNTIAPGNYGNLRIEFTDCANAEVEYNIEGTELAGSYSMIRAVPNGQECAAVAE